MSFSVHARAGLDLDLVLSTTGFFHVRGERENMLETDAAAR